MVDEAVPRASRALPERPSLEHLKKEAKQRLKLLRRSDPAAKLAKAQLDVARDYGFSSWRRLAAQFHNGYITTPEQPYDWGEELGRTTAEALDRGDLDAAERAYRDLIARRPPGLEELQASFALFLLEHRKNPDEARAIFNRLMRKPTPVILAQYVSFAHAIGEADADRQDTLYRHAIAFGEDPLALNHYACFLWYGRKNRTEAERWFRKAADLDSGYSWVDAFSRGIYAAILWEWGDAVAAETWFRLARTRSHMDVQTTLTFAAMLTAIGRVDEGLAMVAEVLDHPRLQTVSKRLACLYESVAWFLRYAHGDDGVRRRALTEIRTRLRGSRPLDGISLELTRNMRAAAAAGHPAPDLVAVLAKLLISAEGQAGLALAQLECCPAWLESDDQGENRRQSA